MKPWRWLEALQLGIVGAMLAWAGWAWQTTPERVPVHWNVHGQVDGWGGRFEGLLLLPLIAIGIYLLLRFIPRIDPGRANYAQFAGAYAVIRLAVIAVMAGIYVATQLEARGTHVSVGNLMPVLMGALFVVLGGVLGKVRPNWFVGVRTPWTLSSKTSWVRTHRLAGWLFVGSGVAVVLAGLLLSPEAAFVVLMVAIFGSAITSIVYSYFVWRDDPDKIPPSGTLPG